MSVNTVSTAAPTAYDSASKTGKTGKTGKFNVQDYSSSHADKGHKSERPTDKLEISEAALNSDGAAATTGKGFKNFDMDAFQSGIRDKLMESINKSRESLMNSGVEFAKYNSDSILYDLSGINGGKEVKAAKVPEYWNAENTSQRIVDFAMSFRSLAPELSDEEYIKQVRDAVQKGFSLAKKALGDLPGPSAKLYNDTYGLAMKKFDDILAEMQAKKKEEAAGVEA